MCVAAVVLGMATVSVAGADPVVRAVYGIAADAITDGNVGCRCRGACVVLGLASVCGAHGVRVLSALRSVDWTAGVGWGGSVVDVAENDS